MDFTRASEVIILPQQKHVSPVLCISHLSNLGQHCLTSHPAAASPSTSMEHWQVNLASPRPHMRLGVAPITCIGQAAFPTVGLAAPRVPKDHPGSLPAQSRASVIKVKLLL